MYETAELEELKNKYKLLFFSEPMKNGWISYLQIAMGVMKGISYDIIFGPVANDTIYRTFIAYEEGILTKDETIARLKVKKTV